MSLWLGRLCKHFPRLRHEINHSFIHQHGRRISFFTLNFGCLARKLTDWHGRARVLDPVSWRNFLFCDHSFCTERFYSRGQLLCKFTEKKSSIYRIKEFDSHRVCLEHQQRCHFIVLDHQTWPPRRHLKAVYERIVHNSSDWLAKCGLSSIEMTRRVWGNPSKHGKHLSSRVCTSC